MPDFATPVRFLPAVPSDLPGSLRTAARMTGFWLAIALPFAYLSLVLLAPSTLADPSLLGAVVGANLLALVVGHGHEPSLPAFRRVD